MKVWNDADNQDGKRPAELKVTLSNGTEVTLSEENKWTATVTGLPKYADGKEIEYTWTEGTLPEGYKLTDTSVDGTVTTLTNSHTPEETEATIRKVWDDANNQDGKRPAELKVTLSNGTEVTLNDANKWTATIDKLPKYADGAEIEYTWTESELPEGYSLTNTETTGTLTTLTNSYSPEKTQAEIRKVWADNNNQDGIRPAALEVQLSNGKIIIATVTLTEAGNWTAVITDLPKYADGQELVYTWTESGLPEGYELTGTTKDGTVTTLTNTHTPAVTEATIYKTWNDSANAYGYRPSSLTVHLLADGEEIRTVTLLGSNRWAPVTITDLPVNKDGKKIEYTWREDVPAGYRLTNTKIDGTATYLTNTYIPPDPPPGPPDPPTPPGPPDPPTPPTVYSEDPGTVLGATRSAGQVLGASRAQTGDDSDLQIWLTLMMSSAAALVILIKKRRRQAE